MRKEIASSSEDEGDDKENDKNGDALVGVVHSGGHGKIIDSGSGGLSPSFYHYGDDGEYAQWLRDYPELEFNVIVTSQHACMNDEGLSSRSDEYSLLEPYEVLTEEEWILGGLTPWIDSVEDVSLIYVDGTHDEEAIVEAARLEEPLHFKTTSMGIVVGQDVKDFPKMPPDWYRNKDEQTHVLEADWKYVDVTTRNENVRQMKMGSKLEEKKIKEYSELVDEFGDTFAWSYDELRGISRELVEHCIPLISGARPIK